MARDHLRRDRPQWCKNTSILGKITPSQAIRVKPSMLAIFNRYLFLKSPSSFINSSDHGFSTATLAIRNRKRLENNCLCTRSIRMVYPCYYTIATIRVNGLNRLAGFWRIKIFTNWPCQILRVKFSRNPSEH